MKKQYSIIYVVYILLGLSLGLWEVFKTIWFNGCIHYYHKLK